jgi:hypothetical protein
MKVKEVMHKGVDWVVPDTPVTDIANLSLGDVSSSAPSDLLSEIVKSVSAHHH